MAVAANTGVWECRTTGNDNNGGGFNSAAAGTDYSQQDAAQFSGTDLTVDAVTTTKVIPDGHTPTSADVGNVVQITAGAGFTLAWYEIKSQDGVAWTLDRSPAATSTSGGTWAMGGAFASPGQAAKVFSGNGGDVDNKIWIKSGTYTLTTATEGPAGPFNITTTPTTVVEGYETTRGDQGAKPVIDCGVITGVTAWRQQIANIGTFVNLKADCKSGTGNNGFWGAYGGIRFIDCEAVNCDASATTYGFNFNRNWGCKAVDCGIGFKGDFNNVCEAVDCTTGFDEGGRNLLATGCVTGVSITDNDHCQNATIDNCTTGLRYIGSYSHGDHVLITNCTTGISEAANRSNVVNVAMYNNTTDGAADFEWGRITLTADPYVDKAGRDFTLNNDAGGGADCQNLTFGNRTNGFVGAFGPAAGGGGGILRVGMSGGMNG